VRAHATAPLTLHSVPVQFDGPILNDRWQLGPDLGAGSQGHTFLACDRQGGNREVVVKQFRLGQGASWKQFDLFEREVNVLQTLNHRGIPGFLDHGETQFGQVVFLVMERAPGRPLATAQRLGEAELRSILVRTLAILAYLHSRQPPVIHRDIKPANLLRDDDGQISLVDFGGVRNSIRPDGGSTVVGTFGYMAPEQLHGQATPATDLYSLGATIVALAGGVEPEHVPRRGLRMDLERHLPHLPGPLVAVLGRMTDPDPAARPQSAKEVLRLLPSAAGAVAPGTARSRPRSPAGRAPGAPPTPPQPDRGPDDEALLDLDLPPPLRPVVLAALTALGYAGDAALYLVQRLVLPIAFTLVSAFVSARGRVTLRRARTSTTAALASARRGFKRLQNARRQPRQLMPPSH
jgi:serine/threonine protein kinase